jgi:hypothetical protein
MKIAAIIASLTVVGSIAYAAGTQGTAGKQPPLMPSGSQAHSMQEDALEVIPHAQILAGGCQTEPQAWFDPLPRRLVVCVGGTVLPSQIGKFPIGVADVNADGVNEFFDTAYFGGYDNDGYSETGVSIGTGSPPIAGTILYRSTTEVQATQTVVWRNSVLEGTAAMGEHIRQMVGSPNYLEIEIRAKGWRDVDLDGDLDLIAEAAFRYSGIDLWFENIGYEIPAPPIAADLNHDGNVDGADLSLLLYAWGQTQ